jgi:exopolysaccharide biosynthesis polyprenyl glycosylphosphotransferase
LDSYDDTITLCEELGIRTRVVADFFPTSTSRLSLEFLDTLPLITFSTVPDQESAILAKRLIDVLTAAVLLTLLAPLMLLTAGLIKFTSRGPVFYRQVRCGLYGRKFSLVKFRTMIEGAEDRLWEIKHLNEMDGPVFKMRNDPRVTPLGRFLRKYSIDEIPQLWNVLKGEMSIVGPRAPLSEEVRFYSIRQRRRLSVKPGITCLWQVSGRSDIDFHQWMNMDLYYIDHWSLWLDLRILLRTIPAVFTGRGAR